MQSEKFEVVKTLGKGKSGVSYLVQSGKGQFVKKEMHQEQVSYYTFTKEKIQLELDAYEVLQTTALKIPKLLYHNRKDNYLIKEYIEGPTATQALISGDLTIDHIREVLSWEEELRIKGLNIDYFPSNFVIRGQEIFYIDYEFNQYKTEWDFTNWGIYYWLNPDGFRQFTETGNSDFINEPGTGIPVKTPEILAKRQALVRS